MRWANISPRAKLLAPQTSARIGRAKDHPAVAGHRGQTQASNATPAVASSAEIAEDRQGTAFEAKLATGAI